jgi:phytoene dehydrogenase-like protein
VSVAGNAGCELRTGAEVCEAIVDGNRVAGVRLRSGEACFAPLVFSALGSRRRMHALVPPGSFGLAHAATGTLDAKSTEVRVVMALQGKPVIDTATLARRFVLAERAEAYISAEFAAREGKLGEDLPIELIFPASVDASLAPPGQHIVSALLRCVPRNPAEGWPALRPILAAKVVARLSEFMPHIARDISRVEVLPADDMASGETISVEHMLTSNADRIRTPIQGLFCCDAGAEPVPAVSGRAARIAAMMAVRS